MIKLPPLITPPLELQQLYDNGDEKAKSFREHIREYNAANAFTSLGTTLDQRLISGRGPTSFTIHGELRHRTGSLIPLPDQHVVYSQLYIYDPNSALDSRRGRNSQLRVDILKIIQKCLLGVNPFPEKFQHAYQILSQLDSHDPSIHAYLRYNSTTDHRRYNLPETYEISIALPGDGPVSTGKRYNFTFKSK